MTNGQPGESSGARSGGALAGKTIIVTGGSRGIGRAIAIRLAREGGKMVLAARDASALAKVVSEIEAGGRARTPPASHPPPSDPPGALQACAPPTYGAVRPTL